MGLNFEYFLDEPFKPTIIFKMIQSAFQIPHHAAIRMLIYAPPRCFSAETSGSGGDGFRPRDETGGNMNWSFPHNCEKVEACSRFVWANRLNVCLWNFAIVNLGRVGPELHWESGGILKTESEIRASPWYDSSPIGGSHGGESILTHYFTEIEFPKHETKLESRAGWIGQIRSHFCVRSACRASNRDSATVKIHLFSVIRCSPTCRRFPQCSSGPNGPNHSSHIYGSDLGCSDLNIERFTRLGWERSENFRPFCFL